MGGPILVVHLLQATSAAQVFVCLANGFEFESESMMLNSFLQKLIFQNTLDDLLQPDFESPGASVTYISLHGGKNRLSQL